MSSSLRGAPALFKAWLPKDLKRRLTRLNHVLIPDKKLERDRLRKRRSIRFLGLAFAAIQSLTQEGRLLLLLMVPISLVSLDVRYSQVHLLFAMLVGLMLAAWAVRPLYRLKAVEAQVSNARRVAVDQELHFEVVLINRGQRPIYNLHVASPFLPWDGTWKKHAQGVPKLLPGERVTVRAQAQFQARGEHHLDSFEAAMVVPGGLAVGRAVQSPGAKFLVVPRPAPVTAIQLTRSGASGSGTLTTSVQPGETDIAGVRPYRVGDELKHLHVRTWARTGIPHVRHYLDESQERVVLMLLSGGTAREGIKEATLSLAAGVAARLVLHQGGVDTLICDEKVFGVTPRTGSGALDNILDRLAVYELTNRVPSLGALREQLTFASSLVIVAAELSTETVQLVQQVRRSGIACCASVVVESERVVQAPSDIAVVDVSAVGSGREIRLC